ncbi:MAG: hypothetical protein KI792_04740 [Alphaproteobacteria bacterium]|nr:hypothetical protein [Alphaproteobacteria bacterium SS10]
MIWKNVRAMGLALAGLGLVMAIPASGLAQSQAQTNSGPTLITPRVGSPIGNVQEGSLPQTPEVQQPTPEEMRRLLRIRLMNIEGGDAYVRQACGDTTWQDDYKAALDQIVPSDMPTAVQAFKDGWAESKERLGNQIESCDALIGSSN